MQHTGSRIRPFAYNLKKSLANHFDFYHYSRNLSDRDIKLQ